MVALTHDSFRRSRRRIGKSDATEPERAYVEQRLAAIATAKPAACSPAMTRQRHNREPREQVYRLARLFISKLDSMPCVVVNLSADGACIRFEGDIDLPEIVTLRFDQSAVRRKARVVWRQGREAGLWFVREDEEKQREAAQ
ncbi:MAG: PilZ domain-containing protein [Hyphococcus sp.]